MTRVPDVVYSAAVHDSYVVTATFNDAGVETSRVVRYTTDPSEAYDHDVSAYADARWSIWCEHFSVGDDGVVLEHMGAVMLYPSR